MTSKLTARINKVAPAVREQVLFEYRQFWSTRPDQLLEAAAADDKDAIEDLIKLGIEKLSNRVLAVLKPEERKVFLQSGRIPGDPDDL